MSKLVVTNPEEKQEIIEVSESGGYFDEKRVIWDERKDGEIPRELAASVGGLVRRGKELVVDEAKLKDHRDKEAVKEQQAEEKKTALEQARAAIQAIKPDTVLKTSELPELVKALALLANG